MRLGFILSVRCIIQEMIEIALPIKLPTHHLEKLISRSSVLESLARADNIHPHLDDVLGHIPLVGQAG
jgi:hypothetical protein